MWEHEHVGETSLSRERVWAVLRDVDDWASWDTSMERVRLLGPFAVGSQVELTPTGQDPIVSTIVEAVEGERYADETAYGGVLLRFTHTLTDTRDGGTRVVHRLEITGAEADTVGPGLGPAITEDFSEAMAALFARAGDA